MKKPLWRLGVAVLLLCAGGSFFAQQFAPGWVADPSVYYNRQDYLIAVGEGTTRSEAEGNALSALSRVFGVSVALDSRALTRYTETARGSSTIEKSAVQQTDISAAHDLINVNITETWHDLSRGRFYALAVQPRVQTMQQLQLIMNENNAACALYLSQAQHETDPLYKFSLLDLAAIYAQKNEVYLSQYNVLAAGAGNPLLAAPHNYREIQAQSRAVARSITFAVRTAENVPLVRAAAEGAITALGMRLNPSTPTYVFTERVVYEGSLTPYGIYLLKYTVSIDVVDSQGTILTTFMYTGTDGGRDEEDALRVLRNRMAHILLNGDTREGIEPLSVQFNQFLNSLL